jgi:hypothetical protein
MSRSRQYIHVLCFSSNDLYTCVWFRPSYLWYYRIASLLVDKQCLQVLSYILGQMHVRRIMTWASRASPALGRIACMHMHLLSIGRKHSTHLVVSIRSCLADDDDRCLASASRWQVYVSTCRTKLLCCSLLFMAYNACNVAWPGHSTLRLSLDLVSTYS